MNERSHDPDQPPHLDELSETVRPAVEQVRKRPVPAEAQDRALLRARRLGRHDTRPWSRRHGHLLAAGGIAALFLLALGLVPRPESSRKRAGGEGFTREELALAEEVRRAADLGLLGERAAQDKPDRSEEVNADGKKELNGDRDSELAPGEAPTNVRPRPVADLEYRRAMQLDPRDNLPRPGPGGGTAGGIRTDSEEDAVRQPPSRPSPSSTTQPRGTGGRSGSPRPTAGGPNGARVADSRRGPTPAKQAGGLPERDRQTALDEATRRLAAIDRANREVPRAVTAEERAEAVEAVKKAREEQKGRKKGGKGETGKKAPQVWRRDGGRPTFARVYVGDGNALELVSLHVSVTLDGPRARTVVDHVFRNPHARQLEGTFEYPLPAGASPSYFAMFLGQARGELPPRFGKRGGPAPLPQALARLTPQEFVRQVDPKEWGKLQEARVVGQAKAAEAYEEVVRRNIDPAVLEYAGGNTFRGRVFPIAASGYNRVVLAYEELLPAQGDRLLYRFPLPGVELSEMRFALQADARACPEPTFLPRGARKEEKGGRLCYLQAWEKEKPEGEVLFSCAAAARVQATSGRPAPGGPRYLYARLRPEMPKVSRAEPFAAHAVFLLDTSLSEHPERFAVSVKLLQAILEADPGIERFNVLCFNAGACWLQPKGWLPNNKAGREAVLARLDGLVLEGATDLSAALELLCRPGFPVAKGTPLSCFLLSDGHLTWGQTDASAVAARLEARCPYPTRWHCYRTGLGQENAELFNALTRKGGATFQCLADADVKAAAGAHRRQCLQVERVRLEGLGASDLLVAGRQAAVYPGGELVVAAKVKEAGKAHVVLEGIFQGERVVQRFAVEVTDGPGLAARGWGEVAVASLLALNDPRLDSLATAYCQEFGIASRAASFLVLENEADYQRLKLEEERGKTLQGDLGRFVEDSWRLLGGELPARQALARLLELADRRTQLLSGPGGEHVRKLLGLLAEGDCELPRSALPGALLTRAEADRGYLAARRRDRRDVKAYLLEAERRAKKKDVAGAVRALSGVVEEHPGRGDALRLVGYRLLDLGQPAQAVRLFARVQRQRPFEPHSYRDLARALEGAGQYGLAALQYEAVLAGTWHSRFRDSLKLVVLEEYARMMQDAIAGKKLSRKLADHFGERLERLREPGARPDLRVTISWNTDATDVDLWVIEPDGTKVFYSAPRSKNGGELSQDQTQGYGPERYRVARARPGEYTVVVHYFSANPNLLGGETHVNVAVCRRAGDKEEVTRHTVILSREKQEVQVCKVKF